MHTYSNVLKESQRGVAPDEAGAPARGAEDLPVLHVMSGHSVIEDGIEISQFEYEPPATPPAGGRGLFASWIAAHTRLGRRR